MSKVCTICARGGSKGVKNKNIKLLAGRPLIYHSIQQALNSKLFDVVAVSSDSKEIRSAAVEAGADMVIERPLELATDTSAKLPVIRHAFESVEQHLGRKLDVLVDLDCTSPLREVSDIKGAVDLLIASGAPNIITGAPARRSPYFNLVERQEDGSVGLSKSGRGIVRRQDSPECFDMNASIYVWSREGLYASEVVIQKGTKIFVMPEERSHDIDSELDFKIVEFLMLNRQDSDREAKN